MANPSLQIGNSNWAIKEDNLLGYSTAGTRFVPQPITMTRESAGTRVNSSGLVETVELLGSELVTDSDFILTGTQAEETTGTYWTTGTDWSISGGAATLSTASGSSSLSSSNMTVTVGKIYKVTINVSATSTGFRLYDALGVVSYGLSLGENVFYRTPSSPTYTVTPLGLAGATGTISNVSVKEYTANNLARVDYDGTASSLLVEPERTNLITTSEDFDSYRIAGSTVTPNSTTAPDGTNSGILVTQGVATLVLRASNVVAPSTTYTFSGYFKSSSSVTQVTLDITDYGNTTFDLTSEWQRFSITAESRPGGSPYHFVDVATNGIQGDTFYAWGLQLEEASYGTSYIPTDGSTVTRVQDQYTKTGISNLINSEEGVLFVEMAAFVKINPSGNITLTDGSGDNRIYIYYLVDNSISVIYNINSTGAAIHNFALADITQQTKIAVKWGDSNVSVWINGNSVLSTATSNFLPNTLNQLDFSKPSGGVPFEGNVKQLQIYKTTDIDLAALTS